MMPDPYADKIKHFTAFICAGGGAFMINALLLVLFVNLLRFDPYASQAVAAFVGVIYSWLINRRYTFGVETKPGVKEFMNYCCMMAVSILVNYVIYSLCVASFAIFYSYPFLALIPATAISMIVSYLGMRFHTFR